MSSSHHLHDRFFRSVFAHRELMEEYVQHFLPVELARQFHLDTLQQQKESYLDKNLHQYFSDVVYTVGYGETKVTLTLLLEHKSYVPTNPWLQLLQYLVNVYTAQAAHKQFTPVVPIIVYHGEQKWKIRTVASYFEGMDAQLSRFVPEFQYLLNDLSHYSPEELLAMDGSWAKRAFVALKASRWQKTIEGLEHIFADLTEWEVQHALVDFFDVVVVYLLQAGDPQYQSKEEIMRTINKINSPAREKVLSSYDQILNWGKEEGREEERIHKNFQVFKKGVPMGLQMADLITLTEVSQETALAWYTLLIENPEAELPNG